MSEFTGFSRDAQALPNSNSSGLYIKQYIENLVMTMNVPRNF